MVNNSKVIRGSPKNTRGIALVAALILMALLSVLGATVLTATSTEISISGNYRRGIEGFYLAEAGIAESRARLRGDLFGNPLLINDPNPYDPRWTAYILTSSDWHTSVDTTFYKGHTNYFPVSGNRSNSRITPNSLQRTLPYWVKLKHKTEYDAEREGHRSTIPHYLDLDGNLGKHTRANPGHVVVYGYPTASSSAPMEFTSRVPVGGAYPVERIMASAGGKGGSVRIEVDAVHPPAPPVLAAIYAKTGVSFAGPFNTVSGDDQCGAVASKPPIYINGPSSVTGPVSLVGNPPSPQQGDLELNLLQVLDWFKRGARVITTDQSGVNWGTTSSPETVFVDSSARIGRLSIQDVQGHGILLMTDDVVLEGPVKWNGLLISTGKIYVSGARGPVRIKGGMWMGELVDLSGSLNVSYDSCAIKTAVFSKPLVITKWKQVL